MGTTSRYRPLLRRRLDEPRSDGWHRFAVACERWRRPGVSQAAAGLAFHAVFALGCAALAALGALALALGGSAPVPLTPLAGAAAAVLGLAGAIAAAAGARAQLCQALNGLRERGGAPAVPPPVAVVFVLCAGVLAFLSLAGSVALSLLVSAHGGGSLPLRGLSLLADAAVSALLFTPAAVLLLRTLPAAAPSRASAWSGALVAAVPGAVAKALLGAGIAGAAGAPAMLAAGLGVLLWLYAGSQALVFGGAWAAAGEDGFARQASSSGARPLRAPPERIAANTVLPVAAPTSLAAARSRLRPQPRRAADGPGVLLQFPPPRARRRTDATTTTQ